MASGAHGDLFPVRYYKQLTPVNWLEANEPLHDLETNVLILDGKLAEHLANHPGGTGGSGGGTSTLITTGTLNLFVDIFDDISGGGTPPSSGTVGTDFDALIFQDGVDENQKFEFTVPQDYDSGDLNGYIQFVMSGTGGGNVAVEISGEYAPIAGTVSSFGPVTTNISPTADTNPQEALLFTLQSTNFSAGDRIRVQIERQGTTDANSDDLKMIGVDIRYTGLYSGGKVYTQDILITNDTDEASPVAGTFGTDLATIDFPQASDAEQKFQAIVPDEWDGINDPYLKLTYAMSTSQSNKVVRIATEGEVASLLGGILTIPVQQIDLAVPNDTQAERSIAFPFQASLFSSGSVFVIKFARRNSGVANNHTGDFKLLAVEILFDKPAMITEIGGSGGFTEEYLASWSYGNIVGTPEPTADVDYPDFSGDFEVLHSMTGNAGSSSIDLAFQGRIPDGYTEIDELVVKVKGAGTSPQYNLKVYAEGSGASAVYTSGLTAAPGTITTVSIPATSLSAQPTGTGKFFVVVEASIDLSETVYASRPFVKYV